MSETNETAAALGASLDNSDPANLKPAKEFGPSGAPNQVVPDVDMKHPAVDANPREGTTVNQNRIDFNDPDLPGEKAVAANLKAQGTKFAAEDDSAKK